MASFATGFLGWGLLSLYDGYFGTIQRAIRFQAERYVSLITWGAECDFDVFLGYVPGTLLYVFMGGKWRLQQGQQNACS